jgi:hypothetical protein
MVKTNHVVGMHFDTFPYIEINHSEAETYFAKRNKTLKLPAIGEYFEL